MWIDERMDMALANLGSFGWMSDTIATIAAIKRCLVLALPTARSLSVDSVRWRILTGRAIVVRALF